MGFWSWIDNEVDAVHQKSYKAAQFERERAKRPRSWITAFKEKMTSDALVGRLSHAAKELESRTFVAGLTVLREELAEYLGYTPERLRFWQWLWQLDFRGSPALTYRVAYQSYLKPSGDRRPQANDGRDVEHGFAAPFVDILVHEGGHAQFAKQAAKAAGLQCRVFSGRPKANDLAKVVSLVESFEFAG